MPAGTRAKPYKRDSSGVAPASPQVAYRALLERLAAHRKKLAAFSALGGDCGPQPRPGTVIILRTVSRSALTSATARFVSSPLRRSAAAVSRGLRAALDVSALWVRRFMCLTIRGFHSARPTGE